MSDTNGCWRGCGALAWRSWSSVSVLSQVSPTAGKLLVGLSWGARRCPLCGILYFVVLKGAEENAGARAKSIQLRLVKDMMKIA